MHTHTHACTHVCTVCLYTGAGFKPVRISGVPHYKLVSSKAVWVQVVRELAAAAMAHSQSVEMASDDF